MTRKDQVVIMEEVMRRHPGARFSFDRATATLPYDYFTVGLPCPTAKFGQVFGSAPTLDLAFSIAMSKLDDAQSERIAA